MCGVKSGHPLQLQKKIEIISNREAAVKIDVFLSALRTMSSVTVQFLGTVGTVSIFFHCAVHVDLSIYISLTIPFTHTLLLVPFK